MRLERGRSPPHEDWRGRPTNSPYKTASERQATISARSKTGQAAFGISQFRSVDQMGRITRPRNMSRRHPPRLARGFRATRSTLPAYLHAAGTRPRPTRPPRGLPSSGTFGQHAPCPAIARTKIIRSTKSRWTIFWAAGSATCSRATAFAPPSIRSCLPPPFPPAPGERVLEGGTGAGAALLCLAARVPDIRGLGIDRDPALLRLARANAAANGWSGSDCSPPATWQRRRSAANSTMLSPTRPITPPMARRRPLRRARRRNASSPDLLPIWVAALSRPLRHRGTLTLILPPRCWRTALGRCGTARSPAECVFPIWPKAGRPARLVLVQGRKHGRSPLVLAPGLVLHDGSRRVSARTPKRYCGMQAALFLRLRGGLIGPANRCSAQYSSVFGWRRCHRRSCAATRLSMLRRRVPSGVKGRRVSIISRMWSSCSATSKSL